MTRRNLITWLHVSLNVERNSRDLSRGLSEAICIGNQMISSAIWNKSLSTGKFFKDYNLKSLKNLRVLIYSKLHGKNHLITC